MTLAATGTCDGCEREGPVQQLERVLLPSGHTATCCPECRYHAERLAERATAGCQGCDRDVAVADLAITELPDGREIQLCPNCVAEAEGLGVGADGGAGTAGNGTAPASRNGDPSATTGGATAGSGPVPGSSTGTDSPTGTASSPSSGPGASGGSNPGASDGSGPGASASAGAGTRSTDAGDDPGASSPTTHVCDQCGREFSVELYRVTTVDDRTEELCADCKDDCVGRGIVTDVELRRAQAFEVLGIAGSADDEEVRQAYLDRVKEVHPDREDGNRSEFMLVKEAYDRLSGE